MVQQLSRHMACVERCMRQPVFWLCAGRVKSSRVSNHQPHGLVPPHHYLWLREPSLQGAWVDVASAPQALANGCLGLSSLALIPHTAVHTAALSNSRCRVVVHSMVGPLTFATHPFGCQGSSFYCCSCTGCARLAGNTLVLHPA
jgi:hypothetical protein